MSNRLMVEVGMDASGMEAGARALPGKIQSATGSIVAAFAGATAAVGAFGAALAGTSAKAAADFETQMAKISTVVDKGMNLGALKSKLLGLDPALGSMQELSDVAFAALANGIEDSATALDITKVAAMTAKAGMADLASTSKSLVGIMTAYGDKSLKASEIGDRFVKITQLGSVEIADLARNLGDVSSIADLATISQDELFGAIAAGSTKGQKSAAMFTGLKATITNLIKPSKEALDAAERLGLEGFGPAMLKAEGFEGTIRKVAEATQGNVGDLAALFGSTEAIGFVSGLTANVDKLGASIKAMGDSSGASKDAFQKMAATTNEKWTTLGNAINKTLIRIGEPLLPTIRRVLDEATKLVLQVPDRLKALPGQIVAVYAQVKAQTTATMTALQADAEQRWADFQSKNAELVSALGSILSSAKTAASESWTMIRTAGSEAYLALGEDLKGLKAFLTDVLGFYVSEFGKADQAVFGNLTPLEQLKVAAETTFDSMKDGINEVLFVLDGLHGTIKDVIAGIKWVVESGGSIAGTAASIGGQAIDAGMSLPERAGTLAGRAKANVFGVAGSISSSFSAGTPITDFKNWIMGTPSGAMGGRADGAPVTQGVPVWTGERGKEMFVPSSSGSIVPNHQIAKEVDSLFFGGAFGSSTKKMKNPELAGSAKMGGIMNQATSGGGMGGLFEWIESGARDATHKGTADGVKSGSKSGVNKGSKGKDAEGLYSSMMGGATSALIDGFMSGDVKGGIKGFSKALGDTAKQFLKQALMQALGQKIFKSLFSGGLGGFMADGGPVSAGVPYVVGERGPEVVVPRANSTVIPNDALRGSGGIYVENANFSPAPGRSGQQSYEDFKRLLIQEARQGLSDYFPRKIAAAV